MKIVLVALAIDAAASIGAGCRTTAPAVAAPATGEAPSGAFTRRSELEGPLEHSIETNDVEGLWTRILAHGTMPIAFDETAYFFYRGPGEDLRWLGDHTDWQRGWSGRGVRVGETDLWRYTVQLLPASRLDYKIVVDGDWRLVGVSVLAFRSAWRSRSP